MRPWFFKYLLLSGCIHKTLYQPLNNRTNAFIFPKHLPWQVFSEDGYSYPLGGSHDTNLTGSPKVLLLSAQFWKVSPRFLPGLQTNLTTFQPSTQCFTLRELFCTYTKLQDVQSDIFRCRNFSLESFRNTLLKHKGKEGKTETGSRQEVCLNSKTGAPPSTNKNKIRS
jgi:hypothetical protein